MKKYGKQLMNKLPDATTELLKKLCTDWIPKGMDTTNIAMGELDRVIPLRVGL